MKIRIFVCMCLISANFLYAQDFQKVQNAFVASYQYEYSGNYLKAIESLVALNDENSYNINLRLGWLYYMSGDFVKSQTYYKKAITDEPSSIEARFGYINPASALENWDDVLKIYLDILKIDPNNSKANYWAAYSYYIRKDFKSALPLIKRLISLYPFDYDSNLLAGKIYIGLGDLTKAKKHLNDALLYNTLSEEVKKLLKDL